MRTKHLSLENKEELVLEEVLTSKDPNALLDNGMHAYYMACEFKSLRLARKLHEFGLSPNFPHRDGSTALSWAPNSEFTLFFVKIGARIEFENPDCKSLSLHRASEAGRSDQVEVLLNEADGLDFIEAFDELGRTPLAVAAQKNTPDVILGRLGAQYGDLLKYREKQCGKDRRWPSIKAYRKAWIKALCDRFSKGV